ncbi:hypothetical protein C0993_012757 [Termitomyces sp. T159_Od127]|nr:hypothetical protein C0993_012757 [Termitomyces sp. T159_Od127]
MSTPSFGSVSKDEEVEVDQSKVIDCPDCSSPTDLILVSSDGIKFAAHAQNLERYSEGFPPARFINTPDGAEPQVVHLDEKSGTLRLLLQYMHLKPQPDIERIPFSELEELANAVEKYLVYGGIMACKLCMKARTSMYPMHVLRYAVKHGYKDLVDEAAKHTTYRSSNEMKEFFGKNSQVFYTWVRALPLSFPCPQPHRMPRFGLKSAYRDQWMSALPWIYTRDIPYHNLHKGGLTECELWEPFRDCVRRDVDCLPSQIACFEEIVAERMQLDLGSCERCIERARRWVVSVKGKIGEVSAFSSYL